MKHDGNAPNRPFPIWEVLGAACAGVIAFGLVIWSWPATAVIVGAGFVGMGVCLIALIVGPTAPPAEAVESAKSATPTTPSPPAPATARGPATSVDPDQARSVTLLSSTSLFVVEGVAQALRDAGIKCHVDGANMAGWFQTRRFPEAFRQMSVIVLEPDEPRAKVIAQGWINAFAGDAVTQDD